MNNQAEGITDFEREFLRGITSFDGALGICRIVPRESKLEEMILERMFEYASNPDELLKTYELTPRGGKLEEKGLELLENSIKNLDEAITFCGKSGSMDFHRRVSEKARGFINDFECAFYTHTRSEGNFMLEYISIDRMIEHVSNLDEARKVYEIVHNKFGLEKRDELKEKILGKMERFAVMNTFEDAWKVCKKAPKGSKLEEKALERAGELMNTFDEAWRVYLKAYKGSELREEAFSRMEAYNPTFTKELVRM